MILAEIKLKLAENLTKKKADDSWNYQKAAERSNIKKKKIHVTEWNEAKARVAIKRIAEGAEW